MRLVDVVEARHLPLLRTHVPEVDPHEVRFARLPEWWRRGIGLDVAAVTVGSTILLAPSVADLEPCRRVALVAHELVHVAQQRAGRVGFACAYATGYLVGLVGGLGHAGAYRAVPAERLAREVQHRVLAACR